MADNKQWDALCDAVEHVRTALAYVWHDMDMSSGMDELVEGEVYDAKTCIETARGHGGKNQGVGCQDNVPATEPPRPTYWDPYQYIPTVKWPLHLHIGMRVRIIDVCAVTPIPYIGKIGTIRGITTGVHSAYPYLVAVDGLWPRRFSGWELEPIADTKPEPTSPKYNLRDLVLITKSDHYTVWDHVGKTGIITRIEPVDVYRRYHVKLRDRTIFCNADEIELVEDVRSTVSNVTFLQSDDPRCSRPMGQSDAQKLCAGGKDSEYQDSTCGRDRGGVMKVCKWCGCVYKRYFEHAWRCDGCGKPWEPVEKDVIEVKLTCRSFEERCEYWMNKCAALTARLEAVEKRLPAPMPFVIGDGSYDETQDYMRFPLLGADGELASIVGGRTGVLQVIAILRAQWPGGETNERPTDKAGE